MKKIKFFSLASVLMALAFSGFAKDISLNDIKSNFNDFSNILNDTLPNAAVQQNIYADAWIGKLFPSAPPHLGAGIEFGVTKFDLSPLREVTKAFEISGVPSSFIFPTVSLNTRVGGLVLPFDVGISFMSFDTSRIFPIDGFGIKYFNIGGDFRWAILDGEGVLPQVSVGLGFYYTSGKIYYKQDEFKASLEYAIKTLFFQAQVSKTFLFVTPYAGLRAIFSSSTTDWDWKISSELANSITSYIDTETSASGKRTTSFSDSFIPQIYGGAGLNFSMFALNLGASWDFRNSIWACDISIRFQM